MTSPKQMDSSENTVHLRCGTDIREALSMAKIAGDFVKVGEPLCIGPVASNYEEPDVLDRRIQFLSRRLKIDATELKGRFHEERQKLGTLSSYDRIVLWFEHDIFDQLILIHLLVRIDPALISNGKVFLVSCNSHPDHPRFCGLGQLSPVQLRALLSHSSRLVDEHDVSAAHELWNLWTAPDPQKLYSRAADHASHFPYLSAAFSRYFAEYPSLQDGLSLTQRLSLESLAAGADSAGAIFRDLMLVRDPQPYAGDQMYWPELGELCTGPLAAILGDYRQPKAALQLTTLGHQLLRGDADFFALRRQEKCFGGVRIDPTQNGFRWDRERSTLICVE